MAKTSQPRPRITWSIVGLGLAAAAAVGLWLGTGLWLAWSWLAGITAVTFAFYGLDKASAKLDRTRIPEAALHVLALAGGTGGALLGMLTFRHKTLKRPFRWIFFAIAVLQAALIGAALWWSRSGAA